MLLTFLYLFLTSNTFLFFELLLYLNNLLNKSIEMAHKILLFSHILYYVDLFFPQDLRWIIHIYSFFQHLIWRILYISFSSKNNKAPLNSEALYPGRDLNPHGRNGHRILSPACLPIPPPGQDGIKKNSSLFERNFERETGFEPATPTLARSCSTSWATLA